MNKILLLLKYIIKTSFLDKLYLLFRNIIFTFSKKNNFFFKLEKIRNPEKEYFGSKNRDINRILNESHNVYNNNINLIKKFDHSFDLNNKVILEIGPGDNFLLNYIYLLNGARTVFLIDRFKTTANDSINFELYESYIKNYLIKENFGIIKPFKALNSNIKYFYNCPIEFFNKLKQNSIDFIYSEDVLEHVFNLDRAIKTISLLLKKNGYTLHQVDLRDHLHLKEKYNLDFLKYGSIYWKFFGDITNRERYSKYISLFKKHNLKIINVKVTKIDPISKIRALKKDLNKEFRDLNEEDLIISRFEILAQKY